MPTAIHHVQLAMPKGGEAEARAFYGGVLGLPEVAKPQALADRGGLWFERGSLRLHLGVERPFAPARKAHVAFRVADLAAMAARLEAAGAPVLRDGDYPGYERFYSADPFGNRLEFLVPEG